MAEADVRCRVGATMTLTLDLAEFGPPAGVAARHRALVLVDETLTSDPCFGWRAEGSGSPLACWEGEEGERYRGHFGDDEGLVWGAERDSPASSRAHADLPDRSGALLDAEPPGMPITFCLWWDGGQWRGEDHGPRGADTVIRPLLGDAEAADWVDWHHGRPDLLLPFADFLAVVSAGVPMTPHALAAFAHGPDELTAMMARAAQLGLEARR
jgi:hypothetical protein